MLRDKLARECGLRMLNSMFKAKRAQRIASTLYLWAGWRPAPRITVNSAQADWDTERQQLEQFSNRLQLKLASTKKESGTRWMNHILGRSRLHALVAGFNLWLGQTYGARDAKRSLAELEERKNKELRQQLAQADHDLEKWMEEQKQGGGTLQDLEPQESEVPSEPPKEEEDSQPKQMPTTRVWRAGVVSPRSRVVLYPLVSEVYHVTGVVSPRSELAIKRSVLDVVDPTARLERKGPPQGIRRELHF